jgi:FkbM family methyltransferase
MNHFLDIGANVGNTFDMYLLKTNEYDGYHIWCFEPSPRHISALRQRCREIMSHNDHNFTITVCPFALSDYTGYAQVYETVDTLGDSLNETSMDRPIELMCGVVSARDFIMSEIPPLDKMVVKIDVEGSELKIVDSILLCGERVKTQIDKVLIEFHACTQPFQDEITLKIKQENIPVVWWTL